MLITSAHQRCLTSPAVSDKRVPEFLSIICSSLQNWGLVCWEAALVWSLSLVSQQLRYSALGYAWYTLKAKVARSLADVWQQLFEQQDITVIVLCTIHFHSWLHENHTGEPVHHVHGNTDWNRHAGTYVYRKPVRDVNELKHHLIETWSATSRASLIKRLISGKIVLMHASESKAKTLNIAMVCFP